MTVGTEARDDQPTAESSLWSDRRSGLEMLRAVEPVETVQTSDERWLDGLRATDTTWREWRGVKHLRLWEALALHHHLDPYALGLTKSVNSRLGWVMKKFALECESGLGIFGGQAVGVVESVRLGHLRVEEVCDPVHDSVVSVEEFLRVFGGARVLADPGRTRSTPRLDEPAQIPQRHSSPYVEAVVAASALYRTVAEGGSYIPGDHSTVPDVEGFLREHYPEFPPTKVRQICEMVRPPDLPKGRKPKRKIAPP